MYTYIRMKRILRTYEYHLYPKLHNRFVPCPPLLKGHYVLTTDFRDHIQHFHAECHEVFSVWNYLLTLTWKQVYLFSIKGSI